MLQVQVLRQDPEGVKQKLAVKHFGKLDAVDELILLDDLRKKIQADMDAKQALLNTAAKDIARLMSTGDNISAESKKQEVALLKIELQPLTEQMVSTEKSLQQLLITLPNLPHNSVPIGKTPKENEVLREAGEKPVLPEGAVPHWELTSRYRLIDFELGNKITGSGFPLYTNQGAKLQRALVQYFLDFNTAAGYTEYQPPLMVNETSAYGTGQLPDKEGQMYFVTEDNYYLIPTSEVPLTNIYRDVIIKADELPVKMTAFTPCFRREAGSYGKDVRGLNRLHQFDKVEIVQLTTPALSYEAHEAMVLHVERLLKSLELPYRILRLCGGDMSFTAALTFDFEVYSAAQEKWLEVSSVSNFETYQTNRMKIRYKDEKGKTQLLHSLNGSSLALPRIIACLLENSQQGNSIKLPAVLHSYFGADEIKAS